MSRKPFNVRSLVIVGAAVMAGVMADTATASVLPELGRLPGLLVSLWLVRALSEIVDERP